MSATGHRHRSRRAQLTIALGVVAASVVVDHLFTVVAGPEGLLAPFGPVHLAALALGFATLGLRLAVTFVVLPVTVWRMTGAQAPAQTSSSGTKR